MSKWDDLIAQADRLQKDLAFVKSQIEGSTFGEIMDCGEQIETRLGYIESVSIKAVELAEALEQTPKKQCLHRAKFKQAVIDRRAESGFDNGSQ